MIADPVACPRVVAARRISVLATVVAVLALARLATTQHVLGTGPISIGLQAAAASFMIWARITFGRRASTPPRLRRRASS